MSKLKPIITDGCPQWADDLLRTLRNFEIQLGHIIPLGEEKGDEYLTKSLHQLVGRDEITEESTETLFRKIVERLSLDGYPPDKIAEFVNSRVAPEAKLPYCNVAEVQDALNNPLS